ncbi:MAG: type 4a pilus biogenesis protein PilO [Elusimicrobia bacterium]|nr:type 4a pilus biogenesis protein PilO [Elusimicrobiota bacterium]
MAIKLKIPELSPEQKKTVFAAALFILSMGFGYFKIFWAPLSKRIHETRAKLEEAEAQIATAEDQARKLPQLEKKLAELKEKLAAAERRIPKSKDVPDLIYTLSDLGRKFHVEIRSISPQGQTDREYFKEVAYGLAVRGSYHSVAKFLTALGISERIFNTRNLSVSPSSGAPGVTLQATLQLLAYQYRG